MNTKWFPFIVAVQFVCAVYCTEKKHDRNISKLATQEVDNRIFKGQATRIENLPYQVYVTAGYKDQNLRKLISKCGGAILRPNVIITAAHCVENKEARKIKVRAGSSFRNFEDGVTRKVEQVIIHESFKYTFSKKGGLQTADYDVALLKLFESLEYSKYIQNVEIPEPDDRLTPGDLGIIAGWGFKLDTTEATVLQKTQLPVMSNEECKALSYATLNPRVFCAGYHKKNTSTTCDGDSGSPFVANNKVYGIVSAAKTDCKGKPSFTRLTDVSALHTWITTKLNELS